MKEYIKIVIAISVFFVYINSNAQNLVPNGSFEIYTQCPTSINQIFYCSGWFQPHKYPGGFSVNYSSSSDYYNSCSNTFTDVPNNIAGYQIANTGNSYIGIALYSTPYGGNGFREYAEVKLSQELIANKKYDLQYFVSMANESRFSITKFDAYLSNDSLLYTSSDLMNIPVVPQLQYNGRIDDTLNWFAVNASFIAQGGERFLTLGNFHDGLVCDTLRTLITSTSFCCSAYYYIDDVSLVEDTTLSIKEVAEVDFAVYPNPSKGNFKVISQQKIREINLMDIGNKIALRFIPSNETVTIDVGQLEVGIYIMQCKFNNGDVRYKKIVIQRS
ncbi:MAG TPA: T9SS type A sorting domain-containing protein [Bacteroidia bacterium]|nr:T9SS type A sorting domain-containing protein [Bacteroidia bacterium]HRH07180.1 T9SS type A sorting domain-containing protein [Bacteroidia bacterium]HRH64276.1 T9SS type A sorting domain-containing protein [Bacteroidia bacterium]